MKRCASFFVIFAALVTACAESPSAKPVAMTDIRGGTGGNSETTKPANEVCGHGPDAHVCPPGTRCMREAVAPDPDAEAPPRGPSSEGGSCGGVAGFHCADGLVCEMPPDQENVADGMGTCAAKFTCLAPGQGCFGVGAACK